MKRLSWFVCLSIIALSCLDQPDCYQLNNNVALVAFKIIGGGTDVYALQGVYTTGTDSVFLEDSVGSAAVGLPLNPYEGEISYTFVGAYGNVGLYETQKLNLTYKALVQFVSEDCGERHVFSHIDVASSDFDSVRILNPTPANPPTSNLELYRCPHTNVLYLDFVTDQNIKTITIAPGEPAAVDKTLGSVLLPLNPLAEETSYTFNYADGTSNTLTVVYRTTPKVLSSKCGEQVFIDKVSYNEEGTDFATVTVKEDSIHDLPKINLELTR